MLRISSNVSFSLIVSTTGLGTSLNSYNLSSIFVALGIFLPDLGGFILRLTSLRAIPRGDISGL